MENVFFTHTGTSEEMKVSIAETSDACEKKVVISKSKRQSAFLLPNINTSEIDSKYKLRGSTMNLLDTTHQPPRSTKIDDLTNVRSKSHLYSFLDENKKYYVTMIDYLTNTEVGEKNLSEKRCFWCRSKFESISIGCPIKFVSDKIIKHYASEISREKYNICQKITKKSSSILKTIDNPESREKLLEHGYYETDGIFCSFNCCVAYIQDHDYHPMYKHSYYLLMKMYREMKRCVEKDGASLSECEHITPAPSWRVLKKYGGFMSIEEYRKSLDNYIYIDKKIQITKLPQTKMIGKIYEEQYIF